MRRRQYKQLRAQLEQELEDLEARVTGVREKIDALDLVWTTVLNSGGDAVNEGVYIRRGGAIEAVDSVVARIQGPFNVSDVEAELRESSQDLRLNRTTISGCLRQLSEDMGSLEVLEKGAGRRPTKYRRRENQSDQTQSLRFEENNE